MNEQKKEFTEITVKFGKGCVGKSFTAKDGKEYTSILVPPKNQGEKSPWETFVVRSNAVHENQFGKGMWLKLPAEGQTTLRKNIRTGVDEQGKPIYTTESRKIPNTELKALMESYKERSSVKEQLDQKVAQAARNLQSYKPRDRQKAAAR